MPATPDHPHLDARRSPEERAVALTSIMTREEKVGQLFQTMALFAEDRPLTEDADFIGKPSPASMILDRQMTHFNMLGVGSATAMATWHNALQDLSLETRLQIPISLSSDPRHGVGSNIGTGESTSAFSSWPEPLGLAAIGDEELVERYGDICRRELLGVGIRVALHPQLDVATEPRWARTAGTFGDDAELVGRLGAAFVRGLGGGRLGPDSLATMIKHFPGNGPVRDGEDPHFAHGKVQEYPGGAFDMHLEPFRAALAAGASQVMPSYGVPTGSDHPEVACGFNHSIVTELLRTELGFDGVVCTDWGLITDAIFLGEPMPARAWGVEHLSEVERVATALDAGVDQFGGEHCTELVLELLDAGTLSEDRIDVSVRRLLRDKFALGLFEQRHVDVDAASAVLGTAEFRAAGRAAQSQSVTVLTNRLTNRNDDADVPALPLPEGCRIHVVGVDASVAAEYGVVVTEQADADVTIMRVAAPFEPRPGAFESMFHSGPLDFSPDDQATITATLQGGPTVLDVFMERPAILTQFVELAAATVVDYGCSDAALLDVLFGRVDNAGRLPVALPVSMAAVEASPTDLPISGDGALFARGAGLDVTPSTAS